LPLTEGKGMKEPVGTWWTADLKADVSTRRRTVTSRC